MKKLLMTFFAAFLAVTILPAHDTLPAGETYLRQLIRRDSILIADHMDYGFVLEGVQPGTVVQLPEIAQALKDSLGLEIIRDWHLDTLRAARPLPKKERHNPSKPFDLDARLTIAPFEEGTYYLPPLAARRTLPDGTVDTLFFDPQVMEVKTMPVDTATFEINDIKGQIKYPLTFREILPWLGVELILAAIILTAAAILYRARRRRKLEAAAQSEPPYVTALRDLDKYRGDKYWAPEKQKVLYSGITDTLRTYIERSFGVNAEEMTTAEIFSALRGHDGISEDLYKDTKDLFELSDFVKFAKAVATDEQNAHSIPTAVRFVTSTYQAQLDKEAAAGGEAQGN